MRRDLPDLPEIRRPARPCRALLHPLYAAALMTEPAAVFSRRHLLGIEGLTRPEIESLLDLADEAVSISRQVEKKRTTLRGRTQINLFFEASTRRQAPGRRRDEHGGRQLQREEGRDADRHRDDAERDAARHHRGAPPRGRRGPSFGAQG